MSDLPSWRKTEDECTVKQAATVIGCHPRKVVEMIERGVFHGARIIPTTASGRTRRYIPKAEVYRVANSFRVIEGKKPYVYDPQSSGAMSLVPRGDRTSASSPPREPSVVQPSAISTLRRAFGGDQ